MVKQYLREENNSIDDDNHEKSYEIKNKILQTMKQCEDLLENQKKISLDKIHDEINQLYEVIDQRTNDFIQKIDQYQLELENLLKEQQKTNELNA